MSDVTISKLYQLLTQTSHSQILQFIVFENEIVKTSLPPATIRWRGDQPGLAGVSRQTPELAVTPQSVK